MKILLIGGTGLLGSAAAKELIRRGHAVVSIALPPVPKGAQLPPEMELGFGNYLEMTDAELAERFTGCEGFVFAAGVDERVEGPPPVYELFRKYNITPLERLLRIAKQSGVKARGGLRFVFLRILTSCGRNNSFRHGTRISKAGGTRSARRSRSWTMPSPCPCWNCPTSSARSRAESPCGRFW